MGVSRGAVAARQWRRSTRVGGPQVNPVLGRLDQDQLLTVRTMAVHNDGKTAQIGPASAGGEQYDQAALTSIMSGLFSPQQ